MKIKTLICALLIFAALLTGCGAGSAVAASENYSVSKSMAAYLLSYTKSTLSSEMTEAGVDRSKSLFEQERDENGSWGDYLISATVDTIMNLIVAGEASRLDGYVPAEAVSKKVTDSMAFLAYQAQNAGISSEEYLRRNIGSGVTLKAFRSVIEMMSLSDGYEIYLQLREEVSDEDGIAYADDNAADYLYFDCLRYTCKDKELADRLAAAEDSDAFLKIMSTVSGLNVTDRDKNGIPDSLEFTSLLASSDLAGEFAVEEGRALYDTTVKSDDGVYTVTMIMSLPERNETPVWSYRMLYVSGDSAKDPTAAAESYLQQWKDAGGGEEAFADFATKYSTGSNI